MHEARITLEEFEVLPPFTDARGISYTPHMIATLLLTCDYAFDRYGDLCVCQITRKEIEASPSEPSTQGGTRAALVEPGTELDALIDRALAVPKNASLLEEALQEIIATDHGPFRSVDDDHRADYRAEAL